MAIRALPSHDEGRFGPAGGTSIAPLPAQSAATEALELVEDVVAIRALQTAGRHPAVVRGLVVSTVRRGGPGAPRSHRVRRPAPRSR